MTDNEARKGYAIAHLSHVDFGEAIIDYLQRIDATLAPYDGHFVVHGGDLETLEGDWAGDVVMIEFPSRAAARDWYDSPAYQEILALRSDHSASLVGLLTGVAPGHQATDKLSELLGRTG